MSLRYPALPFDLRALEIFLAVCESGSMAQAARSLHLTQPAVSLAIAELERKTGTTLFDRNVRPLALTLSGGLMRQRASALIADARQIAPLLRDAKQGQVPIIRVGLVDSLSRTLTVPISTYLTERAGEVSILTGLTATHASELLTRRMDMFIGVDDLEELPGLERWELLVEPYVLLLNRSHGAIQTLGDFKKLAKSTPLIRFSARSQTGLDIDRHLRRLGIESPHSYEFDSPFAVSAMVAAAKGFAITTPLCMAEAKVASKDLMTAKLPGPRITRKLTVVARLRELGQIPRDLADISRKVLQESLEDSDTASE
ncbi:MAG: LysR family transcriptional regulator [Hyphomicrobium sp.]|nr:LysR family transcriptional regulator [Hyphomicrobium sp.]